MTDYTEMHSLLFYHIIFQYVFS